MSRNIRTVHLELSILALLQVEFHHMGTYKLKGVAGEQTVMQINGLKFSNSVFPKKAASSKAEIVIYPSACLPCLYTFAFALALACHILVNSSARMSVRPCE